VKESALIPNFDHLPPEVADAQARALGEAHRAREEHQRLQDEAEWAAERARSKGLSTDQPEPEPIKSEHGLSAEENAMLDDPIIEDIETPIVETIESAIYEDIGTPIVEPQTVKPPLLATFKLSTKEELYRRKPLLDAWLAADGRSKCKVRSRSTNILQSWEIFQLLRQGFGRDPTPSEFGRQLKVRHPKFAFENVTTCGQKRLNLLRHLEGLEGPWAPATLLDDDPTGDQPEPIETPIVAEAQSAELVDPTDEDTAETPIVEPAEPPADSEEPHVNRTPEPTVEPRVEEAPAVTADPEPAAEAPAQESAEAPPEDSSTPQRLNSANRQLIDEYNQRREQIRAKEREGREQFKARRKEIRRLKADDKRRAWAAERWPPEVRAAKKKEKDAERSRQYRERKKLAGNSAESDYA
jgi:hypothetical protein